ncbi:MAG: glutamate 5-kinase [Deltaproteobacteria bacterium]|nr:glutamate 5-kinase [Deltaproteobacteria bacterium]MBW2219471.1 glutamate 5-kinase [Deltaproteobacteria bacterium]
MKSSNSRFENKKRIVVKIGSNVLTSNLGLNTSVVQSVSRQISMLVDKGFEVVLVSSGAMAAGQKKIGLDRRPNEIPKRQAIAAVGQAGLIMEYEKAFRRYGKKVAQILLTHDDLRHRRRYLNSRNTLYTLLEWNVVPIINENDTVMIEEIEFGDNDNLAAMITLLMDADIFINLTDIDGLYTKDPRANKDAELIREVKTIGKSIEKIAGDIPGALGRGGMLSKIKAAKKLTRAGVPMIIAKGDRKDILIRLCEGEKLGTYFIPDKKRLPSRKRWIAFTMKTEGALYIDDGAVKAILEKGKSLLPIGIVKVEGEFNVGACVEFYEVSGNGLGRGLVNYSAADIRKIAGLKTQQVEERLGNKPYDEVIHRDNMTVTGV